MPTEGKPIRRAAVVACMLIALPAFAATPDIHDGPSPPVDAWRRAMEAADLTAMARMHGAETVSFPPQAMQVNGAAAITKDYERLFARYRVRVSFDDLHWVEQPPLVASWGLYTLTLHPKDRGPDVVTHGRFSDVATKVDGGWRYLVDHASVPSTK